MAIFDALDGPQHATLRRPVPGRWLRGWGLTLVGLAGLGLVLATADMALLGAASVLGVAVLFGGVIWYLEYRGLKARIAAARPATERAMIDDRRPARRPFPWLLVVAVLIVVPLVFDDVDSPAAGVLLAMGVVELATAWTLH